MSELSSQEAALQIDLELDEVYQSWFELDDGDDISDEWRDIIFLHFRLAFVYGRLFGQAEMQPTVDYYVREFQAVADRLREI